MRSLAKQRGFLLNPYRFGVSYATDAVLFDGTNDYMKRAGALAGTWSGNHYLISVWLRIDGGDGAIRFMVGGQTALNGTNEQWGMSFSTTNRIRLAISTASFCQLSTARTASATWLHFLMRLTSDSVSGNRFFQAYVNDVSDASADSPGGAVFDMDNLDVSVGGYPNGNNKFTGGMADLYVSNVPLDLSVVANRRKFIDAAGKPVSLGADGSLPTGAVPMLFHHIDKGEAPANFAINRGAGGNLTVVGALTTASTSPSD